MSRYTVRCDIGTIYAEVEADTEDDALTAAIERWSVEASDLLETATFSVQREASS